ncbi:hypothetical protein LIER_05430 [Lithospermum erythrorhizon]|uniref:Uncharacterized protein n=1 Tax=Lithospermum erythrorhizon TaxID=34254 RepID=A0AAV3P1S0_LITER
MTKHKVDAHAFSLYWEYHPSLPLYFFADHRVLKAEGLFPIVGADHGVLEALRVSFSVPNQFLPPCPGGICAKFPGSGCRASGQGIDSPPGPLGNASLPPQGRSPNPSSPAKNLSTLANPPVVVAREDASGHNSTTMVLGLEDQGDAGLTIPWTPSSVSVQTPEPCSKVPSSSLGGSLPPRKRLGSPIDNPRPAQLLMRS